MRKARIAVLAGAVAIWSASSALAGPLLDPSVPLLSGTAQDPLGRALRDVEILILPERGAAPVSSGRTDETGRYAIPGLPAGVYRVAGIKDGYVAFLGRVNTTLRGSLDLILRPAPPADELRTDPLPRDGNWALRLPERSVLRDMDPWRGAVAPARAADGGFPASIQANVEQTFHVGDVWNSGGADGSGLQGLRTRVGLAGSVGEKTRVRLAGLRETLDSSRGVAGTNGLPERRSSGVDLTVSFDPSVDSRLSVSSYYTARDLEAPAATGIVPLRESENVWGCNARWSKELDPRARVDVTANYQDSSLEVPGTVAGAPGEPAVHAAERSFFNRVLGARGRFERMAGDGHRVQVALQAGLLDLSSPHLRGWSLDESAASVGSAGWNVRLSAQDSWAVTGRANVLVGLGYFRSLDEPQDRSFWIPKIGGRWSSERLGVLLGVTYVASARSDPAEGGPGAPRPPDGAFGFETEVEVPLPAGWSVRGGHTRSPALLDRASFETAAPPSPGRGMYRSDGLAASRETTLSVERRSGPVRASAHLAAGEARGLLSLVPVFPTAVGRLEDQAIRFRTARVGLRVVPSGTQVSAEWRAVEQDWTGEMGGGTAPGGSLELQVSQDLARSDRGTSWRLLLTGRTARGSALLGLPADSTPEGEGREVGAGVALAF